MHVTGNANLRELDMSAIQAIETSMARTTEMKLEVGPREA
jgi:hypothetical protein